VSAPRRLRSTIRIDLAYEDSSEFGAVIGGGCERKLAQRLAGLSKGLPPFAGSGDGHLRLFRERVADLYEAPDRLRASLLYPPPDRSRPAALVVAGVAQGTIPLPRVIIGELAKWIGDFQRGAQRPQAANARALWDQLEALGCFTDELIAARRFATGATFVGHATVRVQSASGSSVLIDPFILARSPRHDSSYEPFTIQDVESDAYFVTHTHPDHFDLGTLLRFGHQARIFVPFVERESMMAVDACARLAELGFESATALRWQETAAVGDIQVRALPFYGEQASDREVLHPEVRNVGNVYVVQADKSYAFVADSGKDDRGDVIAVAAADRARHGSTSVVFGGYRRWALYPFQYLSTSVSRYSLLLPASAWTTRQVIMNGPDELLDCAEAWGADRVVPYADGGAPWYWDIGLGPALDGNQASADEHFDPFPDDVVRVAGRRSTNDGKNVPASVQVSVVRPNQTLTSDPERRDHLSIVGPAWPYGEILDGKRDLGTVMTHSEMVALARKKVLLRVLARPELERLGFVATADAVQGLLDTMRRANGLTSSADFQAWLTDASLDQDSLAELLADWAGVLYLERYHVDEIDALAAGQLGFGSMRDWTLHRTHSNAG
jgi:L-ascorbate metabolism protein UlaG (beta-lactamase superfamily)